MGEPSSFCTISTVGCFDEFIGHLCSLYRWHPNKKIYAMVDTETMIRTSNCLPFMSETLVMYPKLDKYSNKNRHQMEREGIWTQFQMLKARVMQCALLLEKDTLYLDADVLVTNKIFVDHSCIVGLSPHYIRKKETDLYGYYNGGMLWASDSRVCLDWIEASKTSRYFDQAALETLVKHKYFEFDESYNMSWWRLEQSEKDIKPFFSENSFCFRDKPIKCVHTHFGRDENNNFNTSIIKLLINSGKWQELIIIERIINKKWFLLRPKQPMRLPFDHTNDSFRELMTILPNTDVQCVDVEGITVPRLGQFVCLYDRDTRWWLNDEVKQSLKVFVGNMDVQDEFGNDPRYSPWIYWSRHPEKLEKVLILSDREKDIESIFVGNIETPEQKQRRTTEWKDVISFFRLSEIRGGHEFTQDQYLDLISRAKYGLSLMGFGIKCHREIELMAVGCVPLIVEGVSTRSYQEPLVEGLHFFRIKEPNDVTKILSNTSEEQWRKMSQAGREWFLRNVHSKNMWNTFLSRILI